MGGRDCKSYVVKNVVGDHDLVVRNSFCAGVIVFMQRARAMCDEGEYVSRGREDG